MAAPNREKSRGRKRWITAGVLACLWPPALGAAPMLHEVVATTDPVPGAPDASWSGFRPFRALVVQGGEVAFIGESQAGGAGFRDGVYLLRGGLLERVVDSDMPRPRSGELFHRFDHLAMHDGALVFSSEDDFARVGGVYRHEAGRLRVVADHRTVIPGAEPSRFVSFGDVAIHQGTVLFAAGAQASASGVAEPGLYVSAGGVLARVVDSSTPTPGGGGTFGRVGDVALDGRGFALTTALPAVPTHDGIYRRLGDGGLETLADRSTIAPHTGEPFDDFRPFSYDGGAVAFVGLSGNPGAVYLHDGALRVVASHRTPYPGLGLDFTNFSNFVATSGGRVAFMGFATPPGEASRRGLFVADGAELTLVSEIGAGLDGRVVKAIDLHPDGFEWPNLYFTVSFEDGGATLYRLDVLGEDEPSPAGPWLTGLDGFRVQVRITAGDLAIGGQAVSPCVADTLCVSGVLPDRPELFVRVVGPRPNGKLWPTLVKFTTSRVEVWIEQTASGLVRYYDLDPVAPGEQRLELDGLADKLGFDP